MNCSFFVFSSLESIIERYKKEFIEQGLSLGNPVARVRNWWNLIFTLDSHYSSLYCQLVLIRVSFDLIYWCSLSVNMYYLFVGKFWAIYSMLVHIFIQFWSDVFPNDENFQRESSPPPTPTSLSFRELNVNEDAPTTPTYEAPNVDSNVGKFVKSGFLVKKGKIKVSRSVIYV